MAYVIWDAYGIISRISIVTLIQRLWYHNQRTKQEKRKNLFEFHLGPFFIGAQEPRRVIVTIGSSSFHNVHSDMYIQHIPTCHPDSPPKPWEPKIFTPYILYIPQKYILCQV